MTGKKVHSTDFTFEGPEFKTLILKLILASMNLKGSDFKMGSLGQVHTVLGVQLF